ncbi:MAG: type II secretion system F family protein [Candidatus Thermoplasmatota archaeon]|nr:type II secretion system F family protein [Candidatus Thermoplasmatota archaeon]
MRLKKYSDVSQKLFKKTYEKITEEIQMERNLQLEKAGIHLDYKEYYTITLLSLIIGCVFSLVVPLLLYLLLPSMITLLLILLIPGLVEGSIGLFFLYYPGYRIKRRAYHIDLFLPYAINFINSMAVAGISPSEIFTTLAQIDLYGELQTEIKKIAKEINIMNVDSITALKHAIEISPSRKFQEFLQGIIGTIQSGSELHLYLQNSVTKLMEDDFIDRKKDLDLLGVIAEIFVTTAIAFPIFLVIILTVFGFFGGSSTNSIIILNIFSLFMMPLIYAGFYFLIRSTSLEDLNRIYSKKDMTFREYLKENETPLMILLLCFLIVIITYVGLTILDHLAYISFTFYPQMDFLFLAILLLIGPVGVYNYFEAQKKKQIQYRLPNFLTEVSDALSTGATIFDSIKVASKSHYGRLSAEIKKMKSQLSWDIAVKEILIDFADRMKSAIIHRIVISLNKGLVMGGNTPKIFRAAAIEVGQVNRLENQRKATMSIYTVVILVCFFVFLAIIIIMNLTIFKSFFDLQGKQVGRMAGVVFSSVDRMELKYSLYSFVFVQSIGAGILSGFMMDGKISSGIRYSCILGIISFIIFKLTF